MYIVCSKSDNSLKKSKMFQNDNNFKIIYVEDIINNFNKFQFSQKDVFYFLSQNKLNKKAIVLLEQFSYKILNINALKKNFNKYEIQKQLADAKICVPKLFDLNSITKHDLPIFCKSKNHSEFIAEFYTINTIKIFANKFNIQDYYFEQSIKYEYIEKIYYVNNTVCFCDDSKIIQNEKNCKKLQKTLKNVSKMLNFDIFSAEFFISKNNIILFDVNPSTGLFGSKYARNLLIKTN